MAASRASDFPGPRRTPRPRTPPNADSSSQPEGITRRALLNILEAFFRRPWLHLLPLILMLGLGIASAVRGDEEFRSVGTLSVTDESLLSDLTNAASNPGFGFETPATKTARQINELLRTQDFLESVFQGAGLEEAARQNPVIVAGLSSATSAFADGDNIVRVSSVTSDGDLSQRLAASTIESYREFLIGSYVSQSTGAEGSLSQRVIDRQSAVDTAIGLVDALVNESPNIAIADRSQADQLEYERLLAAANRAQQKLEEAQDALEAAQLESAQAEAVVNQRVQELDPPSRALTPEGRLREAAMTMVLFGTVGVLLSVATVIVAAMLDRTIRVPDDITAKFGLDVLAVVPNRGA